MSNIRQKVIDYLDQHYTESEIDEKIDLEILGGDWIDSDWEDDGEYDDEKAWYEDHNNNEAEDVVRMLIEEELLKEFEMTYESYHKESGEQLWDTLKEIRPNLD